MRVFGAALVVLVIGSSLQAEPRPALHGEGLPVLAFLLAFLGAIVFTISAPRDGRPPRPLLRRGGRSASSCTGGTALIGCTWGSG